MTDEERKEFLSYKCENLGDYLAKLQEACKEHDDQSIGVKISKCFAPIYEVIDLYMPIASLAVGAYPTPGSLVLGGIYGIVQIFSRWSSFLTETVRMLSFMGEKFQELRAYHEKIYKDEPEVRDALAAVFGDMLAFCNKAFRFKLKKGNKMAAVKHVSLSIFRKYETQFGTELQDFKDDMARVKTAAATCDKKRLADSYALHKAHRQELSEMHSEAREQSKHVSDSKDLLLKIDERTKEVQQRA